VEAARDFPEEEREVAARDAMLILLSEADDCSIPEEESEGFSSVSEGAMDEDIDEDTDAIMDVLSDEGATSLLQMEQSPFAEVILGFTIRAERFVGGYRGQGIGLWVGMFLLMIVWGIICGYLMEFIRRAIRWIRCNISGGDEMCFGAPPAAWFRHVITAGCTAAGVFLGFSDTLEWAFAP